MKIFATSDEDAYVKYMKDLRSVTEPIQREIESYLNRFSALDFNVRVQENGYEYGSIEVYVGCNENRVTDHTSALSWSYYVRLKNGQIYKETSSWSGLNACTPVQMESLEQTVEAIKYLNSVDWDSIVNHPIPEFENYLK